MRLIFIIGSHRTGTKLLGNFFGDTFEGVESIHQYDILRWVNIFSNLRIGGKISEARYRQLLKKKWARPILEKQTDIYVESNGFNYLSANYMQELHHDVRIIHMIRDPRDYVVSYTNWVQGRTGSKIANLIPFWHVSGPTAGLMSRKEWNVLSRFERYCWYWTYKNQLIEHLYDSGDGSYMALRFEDLVSNDQQVDTLRSLLEFAGISYREKVEDYFKVKQNVSKGNYLGHWKTWDDSAAKKLDAICGPLMEKYGYGGETEWQLKTASIG